MHLAVVSVRIRCDVLFACRIVECLCHVAVWYRGRPGEVVAILSQRMAASPFAPAHDAPARIVQRRCIADKHVRTPSRRRDWRRYCGRCRMVGPTARGWAQLISIRLAS
jgi:hypothetical protein